MSTRKFASLILAVALATALVTPVLAQGPTALAQGPTALAQGPTARLGTFAKDGQEYFALSLMPQVTADPAQKNDVVILVDTSASQTGRYRAEEMGAVQSMLATMSPNDRVQLMAVDMKATSLSGQFVAPQGPEMQAALGRLNGRTPLGATDLEAGVRMAAATFPDDGAARTVIYIGDAMSKANMLTDDSLAKLVGELRSGQVSVSSYVVGQERNVQLMAALANHTGGLVQTDAAGTDAASAGRLLGSSVHSSVVWPSEVAMGDNVVAAYPADMPPLRTDRDSVLIGTLSRMAPVNMKLSGTMNGKPVQVAWNAMPERASEDFGFLPKLVEMAAADKGMTMPTAGSAGLREAAYATLHSAEQLAKLGNEALASGNFAGAEKVADAALARDPGNPEAKAIKEAARKGRAAGRLPPAADPELRLTGAVSAPPPPPGSLLSEVLSEPPGFLNRVEAERGVVAGKIRAEVENSLAAARRIMSTNPDQVDQDLKLTLEAVERAPDIEPELRAQLRQQIENAIRTARIEKVRVEQNLAVAQEKKAEAEEQNRINQALELATQRIKQVVDRFDALMAEQRYDVADEQITPEIQRLAPGTTIDTSMTYGGRFQRAVHENEITWRHKNNNFVRSLFLVELSLVPFPDEPPIVYIPADQWEDLTLRRQKYKAVDLGKQGGAEQRIFSELNKTTTIDFVETPLKDVVDYLRDKHNIPIVLATKKLEEASVNPDTPVTKQLRDITLRAALRLILKDYELTYVVRNEVLQITTPEDAESELITKVYPVGDLVVPIMTGSGGFGGAGGMGMMGGGMGMMGGGMGGMGGGMMGGMGGMGGGMMGGMGGMGMGGMGMGGMGGGMFAVEDELKLGPKGQAAAKPEPVPAAQQPAVKTPPASVKPATVKPAARIQLQTSANEPVEEAWDRYFAQQEERLTALEEPKAATLQLMASIRETVRQLMKEKKFSEISTLIQAALRHGQVDGWMYEALALAIRADSLDKINKKVPVDVAQTEMLERALLSAVDFAQDEDQLVMIAAYMAQAGLEQRALGIYQQVTKANPSRAEAYLQGLALAERLNDVQAKEWACVGILSQAWSAEQQDLPKKAYRIYEATYEKLLADGKKEEAAAFDAAIRRAQECDCVVAVTWTGNADIDLSVAEPAGTMVSQRQPRSTSGGAHLGDVSAVDGKSPTQGFTEIYACPQGFSGEYRVQLKNVWGRPTSGKVTIDIYKHYKSEKQELIHTQILMNEPNAVVLFDLKDGRRKEALNEAQVVQVAKIQNATNRALLAQQMNNGANGSVSTSFGNSLGNFAGLGLVPGFFLRGAVGYRPILSTLPTGAIMSSNAVISADRRYVRVSPSPTFTQVTEVNTFNFVTGQGGTQSPGQGGVAGGGGGGFGGGGIGQGGAGGGGQF